METNSHIYKKYTELIILFTLLHVVVVYLFTVYLTFLSQVTMIADLC